MRRVPILSPLEAARLIPNGATLSVSSSSGLGCPDAVLAGIGERFALERAPTGLTSIHPIAAGDMFGTPGMDHLAQPGLLRRVIAGSYPSGPSTLAPPRIVDLIESDSVEAYNIPSGLLFQLHRAAAVGAPGVLTSVGLGTYLDPRQQGGRMNRAACDSLVELVEVSGQVWLFLPVIAIDVAIIRATTADEWGNLTSEDEGAPLGILDQALAAHNRGGLVIAQVKRLAAGGTLHPQAVRVPGFVVDAVVLAPNQLQTTQTAFRPEIAGVLRTPVEVSPMAWGPPAVIARRAAMELRRHQVVNVGFGISAEVPGLLAAAGEPSAVTWLTEQGTVGGQPLTGFQFGCAVNPDAILPAPDQFTILQGGGIDQALLSFLEVDAVGNVNVSRLDVRPHVTAGIGGFMDITARAPAVVFSGLFEAGASVEVGGGRVRVTSPGRHRRFVPAVRQISFSGPRAAAVGQRVTIVTERCVMRLGRSGLEIVEVAPGIDLERDIRARAGFPIAVAEDCRPMDAALFEPGPIAPRWLDAVASDVRSVHVGVASPTGAAASVD